jgi:two-component system nitrate/nitrite response regulator NarL
VTTDTPHRPTQVRDHRCAGGSALIRIVVVSAVCLFAQGLARALESDPRFHALASAPFGRRQLTFPGGGPPDVILLDVTSLAEGEIADRLDTAGTTRIVGLGIASDDSEVIGWAERGLSGLVAMDASLDDVTQAIVAVVQHDAHCSPCFVGPLLRRVQTLTGQDAGDAGDGRRLRLTSREAEILELLALSLSNKEIAFRLRLGVSTVKCHVHNLLQKLEVPTRAGAVATLRRAEV